MLSQYQTRIGVLPTRWRQKSSGTDMEQNYVAVTLCICLPRTVTHPSTPTNRAPDSNFIDTPSDVNITPRCHQPLMVADRTTLRKRITVSSDQNDLRVFVFLPFGALAKHVSWRWISGGVNARTHTTANSLTKSFFCRTKPKAGNKEKYPKQKPIRQWILSEQA